MATVVAPAHRHHAFWLRVVEDLALVFAVAATTWVLFATVGLHQNTWRGVLFPPGVFADPSVQPGSPMSIVSASRPMLDAVKAATALEEKGEFGPATVAAWEKARAEFRRLSVQPIATGRGEPVLLWLLDAERERVVEIDALIAADDGTHHDVAALQRLRQEALDNAALIERYRDIVNYDHWSNICETEASVPAIEARGAAFTAARAAEQGRAADAKDAYEASFLAWRDVIDSRPALLTDPLVVEDLGEQIGRYRDVLAGIGGSFPTPFVLQDVVEQAAVVN